MRSGRGQCYPADPLGQDLTQVPRVAARLKKMAARLLHFSPARVKARRLELGLFQWQVAERCGWKATKTYGRLESGDFAGPGERYWIKSLKRSSAGWKTCLASPSQSAGGGA